VVDNTNCRKCGITCCILVETAEGVYTCRVQVRYCRLCGKPTDNDDPVHKGICVICLPPYTKGRQDEWAKMSKQCGKYGKNAQYCGNRCAKGGKKFRHHGPQAGSGHEEG